MPAVAYSITDVETGPFCEESVISFPTPPAREWTRTRPLVGASDFPRLDFASLWFADLVSPQHDAAHDVATCMESPLGLPGGFVCKSSVVHLRTVQPGATINSNVPRAAADMGNAASVFFYACNRCSLCCARRSEGSASRGLPVTSFIAAAMASAEMFPDATAQYNSCRPNAGATPITVTSHPLTESLCSQPPLHLRLS